ncbi:unnamed protein product [Trifolium pratense]|uniref:Uncharacterized protein n=1 Tax=Trifolium pratense TaxID=57577 RepID=A0ACB0JHR4_TRIPR|nr:unnamed protein product [Trifolium pratense]
MVQLLHGRLDVTIYEVDTLQTQTLPGCNFNLCNKGTCTSTGKKILSQLKNCFMCQCQPAEIIGMGLYATVDLDKARVGRTRMIDNPKWNENFHIYSAHSISNIIFTVKQDNPIGATLIGRAYVPVEQVIKGNIVNTWIQILDVEHRPIQGASIKKGGPREPWHDIHCKLEGPVAWDVLCNFEQRWEKQVGNKNVPVPSSMLSEYGIARVPNVAIATTNENNKWNVQLFRSIDGGAASGFPQDPREACEKGLVSGKDNIIDRSIQDAYINAIRRAKNFIYIENQYFLGSSYGWKSSDIKVEDIGALHLIPKELSLKIVSKIEAGERFSVYIVIPMWPEGIPESASVQAILDWQRRTMEMMYSDIAEALQRKGIRGNNLREYLTFFCLGNRESKKNNEYTPTEKPEPDSDYSRAQNSRRFMIYVHAKMMIVDDEYIIIGSANINQRSMDGARDSEIAIGAFQPNHIASNNRPPKGQIYAFRRSLWYEHLGDIGDTSHFDNPESLNCIKLVNRFAETNWDIYSKDTFEEYKYSFHHLMRYPIEVTNNGAITTLPGFECFPDTKARILGSKSDYLPPILTT